MVLGEPPTSLLLYAGYLKHTGSSDSKMPANRNLRGGKGYKKGKKGGGGGGMERQSAFAERGPGQDYGRVVRILGGRRVALYCNDGVERICKIRGAMCRGPKKQIITVGDVVLFSLRSFDDADFSEDSDGELKGPAGITSTSSSDMGDIILKYESNQWRQLRKEEGVNPNLFVDSASTNETQPTADIFASEAVEGNAEDGDDSGAVKKRIEAVMYGEPDANEDVDIDLI
jgi:initiation factor 1A